MTIQYLWKKIKETKPLVHQITNYVTVRDCANLTLAVGASPVMAHAVEEVAEMTMKSQALVLNIGTLDAGTIASMVKAGQAANQHDVPVVLDPVGAGATTFRLDASKTLLEKVQFAVIRGNASEISTLCGIRAGKGVDATGGISSELIATIRQRAKELQTVIAVSGAVDYVTDGIREARIANGTALLTQITGTGCMTTALIGCCLGADIPPFQSAITSLVAMGVVGEWAEQKIEQGAIGQFHQYLFNGFGRMNDNWLEKEGNVDVTFA